MSKKVSPTLIGAFVMGALGLLIAAVVAFGSGKLFRKTKEFVLYFDGSVNGLSVGAPVKFKGVEVGSVRDIRLRIDTDIRVQQIPVIIQIDLDKVAKRGATQDRVTDPTMFREFIEQGLRGRLQTESFVTGVLYVGLGLFPEVPPRFIQEPGRAYQYPEIPTAPTEIEQATDALTRLIKKLEEVDFKSLVDSMTRASDGVARLATSPALASILESLNGDMPLLRGAIVDLRRVAGTANTNVTNISADVRQTLAGVQRNVDQITDTMKEVQTTIASVRSSMDPDSPTLYELTNSLREVSSAARSLKLLADTLDRNPQALISGEPKDQARK